MFAWAGYFEVTILFLQLRNRIAMIVTIFSAWICQ